MLLMAGRQASATDLRQRTEAAPSGPIRTTPLDSKRCLASARSSADNPRPRWPASNAAPAGRYPARPGSGCGAAEQGMANRDLALHIALRSDDNVEVGILSGDIVVRPAAGWHGRCGP